MFNINLKSSVPIYKQIVDSIRDSIVKGMLLEGDKLPSVREMAKILLVNESTVQRAYRELESMGVIKTIVGRGTFIEFDKSRELLENENVKRKIASVFKEAIYHEMSLEDIEEIYRSVEKEAESNATNK